MGLSASVCLGFLADSGDSELLELPVRELTPQQERTRQVPPSALSHLLCEGPRCHCLLWAKPHPGVVDTHVLGNGIYFRFLF